MPQVFSIFERIGMGGGGKVKSVYHRMNAFAEMGDIDPVLLNLDHSPNQKINFAELQATGLIASGVRCLSLPDMCFQAAQDAGAIPFDDFPDYDQMERKGNKVAYLRNGVTVMQDRTKDTRIGAFTKRLVPGETADLEYTLIDGDLQQLVQRLPDGIVETTDFVDALPIRWTKTQGRDFVIGKNLITDTICRMPRIHARCLFEMIAWEDAVVFFDGVTSAYLSPVTQAPRVLFLHADHRSPQGGVVPRSKFLIENFEGEAIVTSTQVHKAQIKADVVPSADVHVVPHFCESVGRGETERRHLVTISRLELTGKPIHECIEAFAIIRDDFPEVDYKIYGVGAGHAQLRALIDRLGCGDRVSLEGYTTEPLRVFQNALASVYPTTTEGFGLSILEALSNGCPVISYDVNYGPREMIESGKNGELVPQGDIDAIAAAMRRVLSAPEEYQNATAHGLERYTRQAYVANYRGLIQHLADAKG